MTLCSHSDICLQDEGRDSWDVIADYVLRVTHLSHVEVGPPNPRNGRTQLLKEF